MMNFHDKSISEDMHDLKKYLDKIEYSHARHEQCNNFSKVMNKETQCIHKYPYFLCILFPERGMFISDSKIFN